MYIKKKDESFLDFCIVLELPFAQGSYCLIIEFLGLIWTFLSVSWVMANGYEWFVSSGYYLVSI